MKPQRLFTEKQAAAFRTLAARVLTSDECYGLWHMPQTRRARTIALGRMRAWLERLHKRSFYRG